MISRPRKSIDKNFSKNEDNQTQFPIIRSQCSSYNGKGLKDAAGFESRSILSEYMDPLDCVFFSSNQNATMHGI